MMTRGLSRMPKWEPDEISEWIYMHGLGEKLYAYQYDHMASKWPCPSVPTLLGRKKAATETLQCWRCKAVFYSQARKLGFLS